MQLAKIFGAQVTGVCSTRNLDLACKAGADHVIDYTREDFTTTGRHYDLIIDTAARSLPALRRALAPRGTLVLVGGSPGRWVDGLARAWHARLLAPVISQHLPPFLTRWDRQDLTLLKDLTEAGEDHPRHRPHLPAEPGRRGNAPPRNRPRPREDRHHRVKVPPRPCAIPRTGQGGHCGRS